MTDKAKAVSDLHLDLLDALRERGHTDEQIAKIAPAMAFREFCEWHGLIGWAPMLMSVYESAKRDLPLASISGAQSEPLALKPPVKDADPFPAADGWIKWAGGEMPVAGDICVHFRTKLNLGVPDASISEDDNRTADSLRWGWFDLRDDIVAYRVVSK